MVGSTIIRWPNAPLVKTPTATASRAKGRNPGGLTYFTPRREAVEAVKRKRVTQVGSGAWSIYLPKKWIDSWSPEQQAGREVDLHLINNSLLIVPVLQERAIEAEVSCRADQLRTVLLSAYVRGAASVRLKPEDGRFDS